MKKLILSLLLLPFVAVSQTNVDYTVKILRLKAKADDCDGCVLGQPTFGPQDPVFNIWTNDADGNINTNCWIYEDDSNVDYDVWVDVNYEIANEVGVNTNYVNVEISGHESDVIGGTTCSPDSGDDAIVAQQLAGQFALSFLTENTPYVAIVNVEGIYYAEVEITWNNNDTGINELSNGLSFNVYPNPSEGRFNVELSSEFKSFEFELLDLAGRSVTKGSIEGNNHEINLDHLTGAFFLKITSENRIGMKKLMIN